MHRRGRLLAAAALFATVASACGGSAAVPGWSFGPPSQPKAAVAAAGSQAGTTTASGDTAGSAPAMDAVAHAPDGAGTTVASAPVSDPAAPPYVVHDPAAPPILEGTVHDIDFPIIEKDVTVAEGFVVHAWTFGGTVPGPTIRVHLGDTVNVHLRNDGLMSHSIDFHASQTAMATSAQPSHGSGPASTQPIPARASSK